MAAVSSWSVGELANQTGLAMRTLHHYEEAGLLAPSRGNGLYSKEDVARLQQIVALREIGFTPEQIAQTLEKKALAPLTIIEMQLKRIRSHMDTHKDLLARLDGFTRLLKNRQSPSAEDLLHAIRLSQAMHASRPTRKY